jgi:hypothetical protein
LSFWSWGYRSLDPILIWKKLTKLCILKRYSILTNNRLFKIHFKKFFRVGESEIMNMGVFPCSVAYWSQILRPWALYRRRTFV